MSGSIAPSLYRDNTVANTGQQSVVDGKASGPNVCADRLCGTSGKKFFYLTATLHDGAAADAACAAGFHMAALTEIWDPSSVEYDSTRGVVHDDSGQGAANALVGWVRTGTAASSAGNTTLGSANCDAWTRNSASWRGSNVGLLGTSWAPASPPATYPWLSVGAEACSLPLPVWCVQD